MNYNELPDTIDVKDYAAWRNVGLNKASEIFHSKGFPRIKGSGNKLIADKRNVLLFELNLSDEERKEIVKEIARQIL